MTILNHLVRLLWDSFSEVFAQERTRKRAVELALGWLCSLGRRTVSRSICAIGRQNQDWSADYKLYSRSTWEMKNLFDPVFEEHAQSHPHNPIVMALDDTKLHKSGKKIKTASWQRDPLSPPFHTNYMYGLRFLQASLIFPHYLYGDHLARAVPVRFVECPSVKKPGKKATEEELKAYKEAAKTQNLPAQALAAMAQLRTHLDRIGQKGRRILFAVDGSLCNKTIFKGRLDRVDLIARCRKDARLCFPAPPGTRRKYATEVFTPEDIRTEDSTCWRRVPIYFGGAWRSIRYKQVNGVLWRKGAGTRKLRLFVVAPQPYKLSPKSRTNYRQPAYLLSTNIFGSAQVLLQAYFDRWQIEVNHRDEKDTLGVGQAQVRSAQSVPRHPAFAVAVYAMLLIAGLKQYGPGRPKDCVALPKWRKNARRASTLDLITLVRMQVNEAQISNGLNEKIAQNMIPYACA
jgi:hypothetical protein